MGQNQVKEKSREEDDTSTPILMSNLNSDDSGEKNQVSFHQLAYRGYIDEIKLILTKDDFSGESIVRKLDSLNKTPVHNAALGGKL